jgi:hypothetical protein
MTKKQQIKAHVLNGETQKACIIARKFFFGLNKLEKESIDITADSVNKKQSVFYKSIGIDLDYHAANAGIILFQKYC